LVTELLQLFLLRSQDATTGNCVLHGLLGIHVDDGICGGDATFLSKIQALETKFPFGSKKISAFTFTGIEVSQQPDKSINLSQSAYVRKINSIPIDPNRKTQPELAVTENERLALRGLVGSLLYASTNTCKTRPGKPIVTAAIGDPQSDSRYCKKGTNSYMKPKDTMTRPSLFDRFQ
jgi:hypothetical protein